MSRGCPTEHELLARALGEAVPGEIEAHLAACAECRIIVSELARRSIADAADPEREPSVPPRLQLAGGTLIDGKYRVIGVLGTGGMGLVVDAVHDVLGTRVAIKVPAAAMREDTEVRARLLREARTVARLEGDYVGRVLDAGLLPDGFPFVVFERLEGRTLAERLRDEGRLTLGHAVDAVIEACAGLAEAHAAGIVHRDVKPSNLFEARRADGSTRIRVIDFGIAKTAVDGADRTRSGVVLGTPAYMAPEQIAGSRAVDARADVWALGILLIELVTAAPPTVASFAATSADEGGGMIRAIADAGASRRDASAFVRVVARCLRASADERYPTVSALARDLAPFAGERGRAALASIPGGQRAPARTRSRRVLLLASSGAIAAAAVVAFVVGRTPRTIEAPRVVPAARVDTAAVTAAPATRVAEALPARAPVEAPKVAASARPSGSRAGQRAIAIAAPIDPAPLAPAPAPRDPHGLGDRK